MNHTTALTRSSSSTSATGHTCEKGRTESRYGDLTELIKPRISVMVLFSVAAAALASVTDNLQVVTMLHAVIATGFVAASASIANQIVELSTDARMARTAQRPLPTGRMHTREAGLLALLTFLLGEAYLAWGSGLLAASLGAATWILYVMVYTPLKRFSPWNTAMGALAGAMPVLIGWAAMGEPLNSIVLAMFAGLFLWQLPHFMAIAWMYRRDYQAGNLQMLTVTDPSGTQAARLALGTAAALIPISVMPALRVDAILCGVILMGFGLGQLGFAFRFWQDRDDLSARWLLRASLVYLPVMLVMLACAARVGVR